MNSAGRLTEFTNEGLSFPVRDVGPLAGPVIIALHGFPQTSSCWSPLSDHLVSAGYRMLAFDQRGYAPRARPQAIKAYRVDRLAGDVLALADAAEAERFHLLGHDWGAGVGWYLASKHPDRLNTLTAVSTPHPRAVFAALPSGQVLRIWYILWFQLPWLPEYLMRVGGGAASHKIFAATGAKDPGAVVRLCVDRETATGMINWYRALRIPGLRPPGRVRVPTLFVWSDGDPAISRRSAELTAKWVDGPYQFEIMRGVSHWIPEERPSELAHLMLEHLAKFGGLGQRASG